MLTKKEKDELMRQSKRLRKIIEKLNIKYFDPNEYGIVASQYLYNELDKLRDATLIFE